MFCEFTEPKELYEPIRYILSLGGKRLRPALTLMAYKIFKPDFEKALLGFASSEYSDFMNSIEESGDYNDDIGNSLKELLTLPENFDRLTSPNTDKELQEIASELSILRGEDESNIPNRILDKTYMTKLRHAFHVS